jgi:dTDP-4-amino-4,6-dideoxygalactose transaminase
VTERPPNPIVFGRPCFDESEVRAVTEVVRSGWIGQGAVVQAFEKELASYLGADDTVAVSSCTAALHLALVACGVGPGDEVITTPFTFVATINAIEHCGAKPVLVDIDPDTLNITVENAAKAITHRTRAILPVHFGGRPISERRFVDLIDVEKLWLIEDAAHAIGAITEGIHVGGGRHPRTMSCFSFYPNKNLATAEGGAIALADGEVARRLRSLRLHGLNGDAWERYRVATYQPALATAPGFKYNMTDLQAAIARVQLDKLEGFMAIRGFLAGEYDARLAALDGTRPIERAPAGLLERHGLHLYQVALDDRIDRDALVGELRGRGIGAAVHYIGVNHHPYYQSRFAETPLPVSDWASRQILSLPLHPGMTANDVARVVEELAIAMSR